MNDVCLLGRLTSDPELRRSQSGVASCRFTIAVNRPFKNKNTGEYETDFITCVAWKQTAEHIARWFSKGKMIAVSGSLRTGSFQDKNHPDVKHYTTDVNVEQAYFCGDKSEAAYPPNETSQAAYPPQGGQNIGEEDDNGYLSDFETILSDGDVPF